MIDPAHVAGVILAGGKSSRMGSPKHAIKVGARTLLEKQAELLVSLNLATVSVSVAEAEQVRSTHPLLIDRYRETGPLGAIATALEAQEKNITHACILAVDLPGLESSLIKSLLEGCTETAGVIPAQSADGKLEPLCAIYPIASREDAIQQIKRGRYAVRDFAETLIAKEAMRRYLLTGTEMQQLRNVNSPQDL